jgi:hypothetical protein
MYQFRKNVAHLRRATAVAVLFGSVVWLGLVIGAEAVPRPAAWHLAEASSPAQHDLQTGFNKNDGK